jgi:hypothetical protein
MLGASKQATGDIREATRHKLLTRRDRMPESERDETGRDIPQGALLGPMGIITSIQVYKRFWIYLLNIGNILCLALRAGGGCWTPAQPAEGASAAHSLLYVHAYVYPSEAKT